MFGKFGDLRGRSGGENLTQRHLRFTIAWPGGGVGVGGAGVRGAGYEWRVGIREMLLNRGFLPPFHMLEGLGFTFNLVIQFICCSN